MLGYLTSMITSMAVAEDSQLPYTTEMPKALPDPTDEKTVQSLVDDSLTAVESAISDLKWAIIAFKDPDVINGPDGLKLFSADMIGGRYHSVMASMCCVDTTVEKCISVIHPPTIEGRKRVSANIQKFEILHQISEQTHVQRVEYGAPAPVAGRDFCFLVSRKELSDGSTIIWGTTVDTPDGAPVEGSGLVRGLSLWAWKFLPVGNDVLMTYVHVFDPCGWVPRFLIAWLKTSVSDEIIAARQCIYGKEAIITKCSIADCGMSQEEMELEISEHQSAVAA